MKKVSPEIGGDATLAPTASSSNEGAGTLHHAEEGIHVRVVQQKGQAIHVSGSAHIALSPAQTFSLLMHAENEKIFSHLERCTHRAVLADNGRGHIEVESEHLARWRLLMFTGQTATRLRVQQDHVACVACFSLVPTKGFGLLKVFEGEWRCKPGDGGGCTVHLEQKLQPSVYMLPPLGLLLKQIVVKQVRGIFGDLRAEAARICAGKPTLSGTTEHAP